MILMTSAALAHRAMLAIIPNKVSPICQYIKSFLLCLMTETAMQMADKKENMLPKMRNCCMFIPDEKGKKESIESTIFYLIHFVA